MPTPTVKIPPLAITLIVAILMWLTAHFAPAFALAIPGRPLLAAAIALAGTAIAFMGVVCFRHAGTTVNPVRLNGTTALVTSGIYRRTRNPMYLGFFLWLLAWALFLSNPLSLLLLPAFILYMNHFQIKPEEAALTSLFGNQFLTYKSQVRRWL